MATADIACEPWRRRTALVCHEAATATLTKRLAPTVVALAGDIQYENGRAAEFRGSFDRTWGVLRPRLRPAPGNHDYGTPQADAYFSYFGQAAGVRGRGYYSYDVGTWHVIALNSNCNLVPCGAGSPQLRWLKVDLDAHPARCVLAYWHQPRFSSGYHGDYLPVGAFWKVLHAAGADVVINGHDHDYERFAPQDPAGRRDLRRGIREFVVGTGGRELRAFSRIAPNSERRHAGTFGVLAVELRPRGYTWRFVAEGGRSLREEGFDACH